MVGRGAQPDEWGRKQPKNKEALGPGDEQRRSRSGLLVGRSTVMGGLLLRGGALQEDDSKETSDEEESRG